MKIETPAIFGHKFIGSGRELAAYTQQCEHKSQGKLKKRRSLPLLQMAIAAAAEQYATIQSHKGEKGRRALLQCELSTPFCVCTAALAHPGRRFRRQLFMWEQSLLFLLLQWTPSFFLPFDWWHGEIKIGQSCRNEEHCWWQMAELSNQSIV